MFFYINFTDEIQILEHMNKVKKMTPDSGSKEKQQIRKVNFFCRSNIT